MADPCPQRRDRKKALGPAEKREVVKYIREEHKGSIRQACHLVGIHQSVYYYRTKPKADDAIRQQLQTMAEVHNRWGFWMMFHRLRMLQFNDNHKVYRTSRDPGRTSEQEAREDGMAEDTNNPSPDAPETVKDPYEVKGGAQQGGLDDAGADTNYRWFDYTAETRAAIVTGIPFVIMHTKKLTNTTVKETFLVTVMIQLPKSVATSTDDYEKREWMNPNTASELADMSIRMAHLLTSGLFNKEMTGVGLQAYFERTFIRNLETQLSIRWPGIDLPGTPGARVISRQNIPSQYMVYATPFVP